MSTSQGRKHTWASESPAAPGWGCGQGGKVGVPSEACPCHSALAEQVRAGFFRKFFREWDAESWVWCKEGKGPLCWPLLPFHDRSCQLQCSRGVRLRETVTGANSNFIGENTRGNRNVAIFIPVTLIKFFLAENYFPLHRARGWQTFSVESQAGGILTWWPSGHLVTVGAPHLCCCSETADAHRTWTGGGLPSSDTLFMKTGIGVLYNFHGLQIIFSCIVSNHSKTGKIILSS